MWAKLSASQILLLPPWIKFQLPRIRMVWENSRSGREERWETHGGRRTQIWRCYCVTVIRVCKPGTSQWAASPSHDQIVIQNDTHIGCKTLIDLVTTQCDVKLQWLQPNPVVSQVHKASAAHSSVGASPLHDRTIMRLTSTVRKSWIVLLSALPSQSHQSKQLLLWRSQASFEQPEEQGILLNLSSC